MKTNRRDFLKTLGGIAAFTIVPRHVLGNGFIAPSDQLTKGIIGTGGMGRGHVDYAGTRLVAVCDVDKNHLELGKQLVKDKIAAYHDFRDLILDPNVDIVHIATPPHWHGIMSVEAAKAGKDIWCEKPMTRTIGEGNHLMEAMKQYGRMLVKNIWNHNRCLVSWIMISGWVRLLTNLITRIVCIRHSVDTGIMTAVV